MIESMVNMRDDFVQPLKSSSYNQTASKVIPLRYSPEKEDEPYGLAVFVEYAYVPIFNCFNQVVALVAQFYSYIMVIEKCFHDKFYFYLNFTGNK